MRCVATDAGEDADRQQAKQNVETLLKALPPLATPDMPKKFDPKAEDGPWHGSHGMAAMAWLGGNQDDPKMLCLVSSFDS
jgi:hypothetical protein